MSLRAGVRATRGTFSLDVSLSAERGEVWAVLGPNGSGKTTLLHALAGLIPVQDGQIRFDDVTWDDPEAGIRLAAERRHTGLVLADHLLFPHLSVVDNVAFGLRTRGVSRGDARGRARTELAAVGLAGYAERKPRELSSGQAQRVALARALAPEPVLLLLDEPLAALDPSTRARTRADLGRRLRGYGGVTVLVTHDPLDALSLADRLLFIDGGHAVQTGTPAELVAHPRDPYVAQVVGLNLLSGTAMDEQHVLVGRTVVVVADAPAAGPAWVAIAPSAIALYPLRPQGSPRNTWPVTVTDIELAGQAARVSLAGPWPLTAEVTVASVSELRLGVGQQLWATVKATEVRAYPA